MPVPNTQNKNTVHIDEHGKRATASVQWLLERDIKTHPITPNNTLQIFICGKEGFEAIAHDIQAAQETVDIVCWGFDPAMELLRSGHEWPRGGLQNTYGELLRAAAARGVKVRLLLWYSYLDSAQMDNLDGFAGMSPQLLTETSIAARKKISDIVGGPPTVATRRMDYCVQWWGDAKAGSIANLELRFRATVTDKVKNSLASEEDPPDTSTSTTVGFINEKVLLEDHAAHHQKPILIDYLYKQGTKAVGYVMGLNSQTGYWDTAAHEFDTPLREVDWKRSTKTAGSLPKGQFISRDPLQDYGCRVKGTVLQSINENFYKAWDRAAPASKPLIAGPLAPERSQKPPQLADRDKSGREVRAQIVLTQPEEKDDSGQPDKTIKKIYYQATSFARNYLYIENQYFFYECWARYLKANRKEFMTWMQGAGKAAGEAPVLHVFIVIPHPENPNMVPRTYDTVKSLGMADSFVGQDKAMTAEAGNPALWRDYAKKRDDLVLAHAAKGTHPDADLMALPRPKAPLASTAVYATALKVNAPVRNHTTGEIADLGLRVLMARMVTFNTGVKLSPPEANYRQVYIHSKLLLIDDAFVTLGSANLNQRSMAADSEINIATDDHNTAKDLRQRVFALQTGQANLEGGDGSPDAIKKTFENWMKLMNDNKAAASRTEPIVGFILPFEDDRTSFVRYA